MWLTDENVEESNLVCETGGQVQPVGMNGHAVDVFSI
jgi:hypothetical protein